ncbi:uncharacterized protein N7483_001216 [Penicillium malachiteum]|uniref:uncharacterized protein n=1 Tax=Penicillium malachiteum TaxID=1324776 RepID=UPI0025499912|nr:uncharacterized protein N7483_001216 [Penicillium malachiteum]KAJ5736091.1 hypothetical protein N7483_001216 [Penicillium malachiteum]
MRLNLEARQSIEVSETPALPQLEQEEAESIISDVLDFPRGIEGSQAPFLFDDQLRGSQQVWLKEPSVRKSMQTNHTNTFGVLIVDEAHRVKSFRHIKMTPNTTIAQSSSRNSDFELAYASPVVLSLKGAILESLRQHNSNKGQPRGSNDESGKLSTDGRKRRSHGSSSDEDCMTPDGFLNEDLRVGGPYICSFPVEMTLIPQNIT